MQDKNRPVHDVMALRLQQKVNVIVHVYPWQIVHEKAALLTLQGRKQNQRQEQVKSVLGGAALGQKPVCYDAFQSVCQYHGCVLLGNRSLRWKSDY